MKDRGRSRDSIRLIEYSRYWQLLLMKKEGNRNTSKRKFDERIRHNVVVEEIAIVNVASCKSIGAYRDDQGPRESIIGTINVPAPRIFGLIIRGGHERVFVEEFPSITEGIDDIIRLKVRRVTRKGRLVLCTPDLINEVIQFIEVIGGKREGVDADRTDVTTYESFDWTMHTAFLNVH